MPFNDALKEKERVWLSLLDRHDTSQDVDRNMKFGSTFRMSVAGAIRNTCDRNFLLHKVLYPFIGFQGLDIIITRFVPEVEIMSIFF